MKLISIKESHARFTSFIHATLIFVIYIYNSRRIKFIFVAIKLEI